LWDIASGKELSALKGHEGRIRWLALSPDGKTLVSASGDRDPDLRMWNVSDGTGRVLEGHERGITCIDFSRNGKAFVSGARDGKVIVWDPQTGKEKAAFNPAKLIDAIAYSPDGKVLAIGCAAARASDLNTSSAIELKLVDAASGTVRATLEGHTESVISLAFSADGKSLVSGSRDGVAKVWDVGSRKERASLTWDKYNAISNVTLTPDGETVVMLARDKPHLKLWHPATGRTRDVFRAERATLRGMAISASALGFIGRTVFVCFAADGEGGVKRPRARRSRHCHQPRRQIARLGQSRG
jgi:WD40 repeat protein